MFYYLMHWIYKCCRHLLIINEVKKYVFHISDFIFVDCNKTFRVIYSSAFMYWLNFTEVFSLTNIVSDNYFHFSCVWRFYYFYGFYFVFFLWFLFYYFYSFIIFDRFIFWSFFIIALHFLSVSLLFDILGRFY